MRLLAKLGWMGALLVAVMIYPTVAVVASGAIDAYIVAAKPESMVKFNKDNFEPRDPKMSDAEFRKRIMEVYGNAVDYSTPVLFVPKENFIRPAEAPDIIILPVDKEKGENPLQVKSLYFFAKYIVTVASVAFAALLGLHLFLARSSRKAPPAPAA